MLRISLQRFTQYDYVEMGSPPSSELEIWGLSLSDRLAARRRCWNSRPSGFRRSLLNGLRLRMRRFRCRHVEQLRDGDELEPLGLKLIEGRRHCLDCSRMNVVGKHDRTGSRLLKN